MPAPAVLIPVQDLFYVTVWRDEEGKTQSTLECNTNLFTLDLINLLRDESGAVLYVLLSNYQEEDLDIVLRTTVGTLATRHWQMDLLPFLLDQFVQLGIAAGQATVRISRDMQLLSGYFFPQEVKWAKEDHSHRLYIHQLTAAPRDDLVSQYQLHPIPFNNSFVEPEEVARQLDVISHIAAPNTPPADHVRKALILLDIDHTLLDNLRSSIYLKTMVNEAVLSAVKKLCTTLEGWGYDIELLAMTARDPDGDARFARHNHPFAMQAVVAEASNVLNRHIKTDFILSFSNRYREPPKPKRRKLDYLESLMLMGMIANTYKLVALVDDCPYECHPNLVSENRADLKRNHAVECLTVFQVQRANYLANGHRQLAKVLAEQPIRRWGLTQLSLQPPQDDNEDTLPIRNTYA